MMDFYEFDEENGITVIKHLNRKKIMIALIVLLTILVMIFIYVFSINRKMKELGSNTLQENGQVVEQTEEQNVNEQVEEEEKIEIRLPQLTDVGRENMKTLYHSEEKVAYLTFDDGPSTNITPQILETLDKYEIKATFFVLGMNVDRYHDLIKEEYKKGHYIANHGYTHKYDKIYSNVQEVLNEYTQTEQAIRNALELPEYSSHLFRFPGGSTGTKYRAVKSEAKSILASNDVEYVDWNALTNDSVGTPTEESIMQNLVDTVGTKNTVVILMHDSSTKQLTADMLPKCIDYLKEQGYSFKNFYDVIQ